MGNLRLLDNFVNPSKKSNQDQPATSPGLAALAASLPSPPSNLAALAVALPALTPDSASGPDRSPRRISSHGGRKSLPATMPFATWIPCTTACLFTGLTTKRFYGSWKSAKITLGHRTIFIQYLLARQGSSQNSLYMLTAKKAAMPIICNPAMSVFFSPIIHQAAILQTFSWKLVQNHAGR